MSQLYSPFDNILYYPLVCPFGGRYPWTWTKVQALAYLKSLSPVALWVPGMQTDGFRVDGDVTYLTQLTDLSGNGNDITQTTATAQCEYDTDLKTFSFDGVAQKSNGVMSVYCPYVYPDDVSVVHNISSVADEVLGDELNTVSLPMTVVATLQTVVVPVGVYKIQFAVEGTGQGGIGGATISGGYYKYAGDYTVYVITNNTIAIYFYIRDVDTTISNISIEEVLSGTPIGTTTLKLGQTAAGALTAQTFSAIAAFSEIPTVYEQSVIEKCFAILEA